MDDCLSVDVGFKLLYSKVIVCVVLGMFIYGIVGVYVVGMLIVKKIFLLQIGVSYQFGGGFEVFGFYVKNIVVYQVGIIGLLVIIQVVFDIFGKQFKFEQLCIIEGGLCQVGDFYQVLLVLYDVKFDNCLLVILQCVGIVGCVSGYVNVGLVSSCGVELVVNFKFVDDLYWFNLFFYNCLCYDNDYVSGFDVQNNLIVVFIKGKIVVDSFKQLIVLELVWMLGLWDLCLFVYYIGKCYYIYINDVGVLLYWLFNVVVGYDFGKFGFVEDIKFVFNVINFVNKCYFGIIGFNGFVVSDVGGIFQILLVGVLCVSMLMVIVWF